MRPALYRYRSDNTFFPSIHLCYCSRHTIMTRGDAQHRIVSSAAQARCAPRRRRLRDFRRRCRRRRLPRRCRPHRRCRRPPLSPCLCAPSSACTSTATRARGKASCRACPPPAITSWSRTIPAGRPRSKSTTWTVKASKTSTSACCSAGGWSTLGWRRHAQWYVRPSSPSPCVALLTSSALSPYTSHTHVVMFSPSQTPARAHAWACIRSGVPHAWLVFHPRRFPRSIASSAPLSGPHMPSHGHPTETKA